MGRSFSCVKTQSRYLQRSLSLARCYCLNSTTRLWGLLLLHLQPEWGHLLEEQVLSRLLPPYPGVPHLESPSLSLPDPHGTVWGGEGVAAWIWVKMTPHA